MEPKQQKLPLKWIVDPEIIKGRFADTFNASGDQNALCITFGNIESLIKDSPQIIPVARLFLPWALVELLKDFLKDAVIKKTILMQASLPARPVPPEEADTNSKEQKTDNPPK